MAEVKLLGTWPSPFYYRVVWVLKLKGIAYEFIEEDLNNKGPLLLQHNPVHKKIPVLIHSGKSICESMIILEYIQEIWPQNSLLPADPYDRAIARFWIKFAEDKVNPLAFAGFYGEEQKKAIRDSLEMLETTEEHALRDKTFFGGDKIDLVDIAFGQLSQWLQMVEDVTNVKLLDASKFPRLQRWINNFKQVPIIKENLPDYQEMFAYFKALR
ncbi:hypothetical protein Godav_015105, partial [Gossypium davidsonii]|nr:hypothetical protein [Gossypium davidsonii]